MRRGGGFAAASPPRTALFVRARPKYICKLFIYRGTSERPQDARLARPTGPATRRRGGVGFGRARAAVSAPRLTAAPRGPPRCFEDRRWHTESSKHRDGVEVSARAARVRDDRPRTERFRGQALSVHSKTCFRDRSQQFRGPRVRPEIVEIDPVGATACLCGHTPLTLQSFVCPKLPLGPLVSLYDALRQWF